MLFQIISLSFLYKITGGKTKILARRHTINQYLFLVTVLGIRICNFRIFIDIIIEHWNIKYRFKQEYICLRLIGNFIKPVFKWPSGNIWNKTHTLDSVLYNN